MWVRVNGDIPLISAKVLPSEVKCCGHCLEFFLRGVLDDKRETFFLWKGNPQRVSGVDLKPH